MFRTGIVKKMQKKYSNQLALSSINTFVDFSNCNLLCLINAYLSASIFPLCCLPTCLLSWVHYCLFTYLHTWLPFCLPISCMPTYLLANLSVYLRQAGSGCKNTYTVRPPDCHLVSLLRSINVRLPDYLTAYPREFLHYYTVRPARLSAYFLPTWLQQAACRDVCMLEYLPTCIKISLLVSLCY